MFSLRQRKRHAGIFSMSRLASDLTPWHVFLSPSPFPLTVFLLFPWSDTKLARPSARGAGPFLCFRDPPPPPIRPPKHLPWRSQLSPDPRLSSCVRVVEFFFFPADNFFLTQYRQEDSLNRFSVSPPPFIPPPPEWEPFSWKRSRLHHPFPFFFFRLGLVTVPPPRSPLFFYRGLLILLEDFRDLLPHEGPPPPPPPKLKNTLYARLRWGNGLPLNAWIVTRTPRNLISFFCVEQRFLSPLACTEASFF